MTKQRSSDWKMISRRQQRGYAWHYWSQWIAIGVIPLVGACLALMNAILSWLPVQWLIVVVAFCSAIAQVIQVYLQVRLSPPQREPADKLSRSMK